MPNRIIKRTFVIDELGNQKTHSANELIFNFLSQDENRKFGEISKFLKENKLPYSRKGLALRLNSLHEEGFIRFRPTKRGHRLYSLSKRGKGNIALQAKLFSSTASGLFRLQFPPYNDENKKDKAYFLKKIVNEVGFFILFSWFRALSFTSPKKSDEENSSILEDWVINSFPIESLSNYLPRILDEFLTYRSDEEFSEPVYASPQKRQMILRFEKMLQKIWPHEYQFCESRFFELSDDLKKEYKLTSFIKTYENWIKRLDRKMKNTKRNLKPNECPRCHYDGIGPVKSGPFKDVKGFSGFTKFETVSSGTILRCDICKYQKLIV